MTGAPARMIAVASGGLADPACAYWREWIQRFALREDVLLLDDPAVLSESAPLLRLGQVSVVVDLRDAGLGPPVDWRAAGTGTLRVYAIGAGLSERKLGEALERLKSVEASYVLCAEPLSIIEARVPAEFDGFFSAVCIHLPMEWFPAGRSQSGPVVEEFMVIVDESEGFDLARETIAAASVALGIGGRAHLVSSQRIPASIGPGMRVVDLGGDRLASVKLRERCWAEGISYSAPRWTNWWEPCKGRIDGTTRGRAGSLRRLSTPVAHALKEAARSCVEDYRPSDQATEWLEKLATDRVSAKVGPRRATPLTFEIARRFSRALRRPEIIRAGAELLDEEQLRRCLWELSSAAEASPIPSELCQKGFVALWRCLCSSTPLYCWSFLVDYFSERWDLANALMRQALRMQASMCRIQPDAISLLVGMELNSCLCEWAFKASADRRSRCSELLHMLDEDTAERRASFESQMYRSIIWTYAGERDKALEACDQAVARNSDPLVWLNVALHACLADSPDIARAILSRWPLLADAGPAARFQLSAALAIMGQRDEALRVFEPVGREGLAALSESMWESTVFHLWRAILAAIFRWPEEARESRQALTAYPFSAAWARVYERFERKFSFYESNS